MSSVRNSYISGDGILSINVAKAIFFCIITVGWSRTAKNSFSSNFRGQHRSRKYRLFFRGMESFNFSKQTELNSWLILYPLPSHSCDGSVVNWLIWRLPHIIYRIFVCVNNVICFAHQPLAEAGRQRIDFQVYFEVSIGSWKIGCFFGGWNPLTFLNKQNSTVD